MQEIERSSWTQNIIFGLKELPKQYHDRYILFFIHFFILAFSSSKHDMTDYLYNKDGRWNQMGTWTGNVIKMLILKLCHTERMRWLRQNDYRILLSLFFFFCAMRITSISLGFKAWHVRYSYYGCHSKEHFLLPKMSCITSSWLSQRENKLNLDFPTCIWVQLCEK